jgi:hypothetical protein
VQASTTTPVKHLNAFNLQGVDQARGPAEPEVVRTHGESAKSERTMTLRNVVEHLLHELRHGLNLALSSSSFLSQVLVKQVSAFMEILRVATRAMHVLVIPNQAHIATRTGAPCAASVRIILFTTSATANVRVPTVAH